MRKVLLVEDHPFVADATARLLAQLSDDVEVVKAGTAREATRQLDQESAGWSRIFLDLAVPGAFGLSLAKHVRCRGLASICCVVSAYDREDYVRELRAWGFLGYVAKSAPVDALTARISDAMQGIGSFPAAFPPRKPSAIRLTVRQTEILESIQQGLSSKQIAARMHLAEGTVNNQVTALMQVLHADSRSHAVAKAIGLGLLDIECTDGASLADTN